MSAVPPSAAPVLPAAVIAERQSLRQRLRAERDRWMASEPAVEAGRRLESHLGSVLAQLVPECLGVYWPLGSEFNAARPWQGGDPVAPLPLALPFAQREPHALHYRQWDGRPPVLKDECGIATASGAPVLPDVLLLPCLGYTDEGFRLGYGGGYFDRYLAAHPHVTAIGVAWSCARMDEGAFTPQPHDRPLMLVVTEDGVAG